MKYIVTNGAPISSIGKGTCSSSIGVVLRMHGLNVTSIKIDPYLNVDAGTISPYEHGECYVTSDGMPSDLDLGSYERFLDTNLLGCHNITTGKIMTSILNKERAGEYLGKTVQVVPHFTNEVIQWIQRVSNMPVTPDGVVPDVCLVELGGCVGDLEIAAMLEALRQLTYQSDYHDICHVHVSLIVTLDATGEQKSKAVQHGVRRLRGYGINPDFLFLRCKTPLKQEIKEKLSNFCQVKVDNILGLPDVINIYEVPMMLTDAHLWKNLQKRLRLPDNPRTDYYTQWTQLLHKFAWNDNPVVHIGIVGKYTGLHDSYLSLKHAVHHACANSGCKPDLQYIDADSLVDDITPITTLDAIIVPGGYGQRGINGMKLALRHARTHGIACLGICLGFELMVIDILDELGFNNVTSEEFAQSPFDTLAIKALYDLSEDIDKSTRLGMKNITVLPKTLAWSAFQKDHIIERHRHRYAVDTRWLPTLKTKGMILSGSSHEGQKSIVEIMELQTHPFFLGVQFHPEFNSRPFRPHPLFLKLIQTASRSNIPAE